MHGWKRGAVKSPLYIRSFSPVGFILCELCAPTFETFIFPNRPLIAKKEISLANAVLARKLSAAV
jgi:hypothetical protein